jgi:anthranilate phosphoribosyltransferase
MRPLLQDCVRTAVLLLASEGEPFAQPLRRPRLELFRACEVATLFEAESESVKTRPDLPENATVQTTVAWMRDVLAGRRRVPPPLVAQLAACLYASGQVASLEAAMARLSAL